MTNSIPHLDVAGALFGRDGELDLLLAALDDAVRGQGRLVLVSGEAGIGKSTLVRKVSAIARDSGALALTGYCYDLDAARPFGPWIDALRACAADGDGYGQVLALLDRDASGLPGGAVALYERVWSLLAAGAANRPLVVVLEDGHWSDQASLDLLRFIGRRLHEARMFVVLTYRDVDLAPGHVLYRLLPTLVREAGGIRIALRPLDHSAVRALVEARYALSPADVARLVEYLMTYAEGNPFFAEELLGDLEFDRVLHSDGAQWSLGNLSGLVTPPLVRQVVSARLERLDAEAQRLLQVAAVLGVEAPLDLWQTVARATDEQLVATLEQALDARIMEEAPGRPALRFRHALIREALYEQLVLPRRRTLHRLAGEWLEGLPGADPDIVAHHFQSAGDERRAATWLVNAGRRASRSFAYQISTDRFERAVAILERLPGTENERAWLLCEQAEANRYTDTHRAMAYVNQAHALMQTQDDPALRAIVLRSRSHIRGFLGENALDEFEDALVAYDALGPADRERIERSALRYTVQAGTLGQRIAYYGRFGRARPFRAISGRKAGCGRAGRPPRAWIGGVGAGDGSGRPGPAG